jgi:dihydrofolate reductase
MPKIRVHALTMSLDGCVAGPDQSLERPLGVGGERLHDWAFATREFRRLHGMDGGEDSVDNDWAARGNVGIGATVMGRNMFGPVRGPWPDDAWKGWWGDDPPFHHPVFVLTHHAREPLAMDGGTTFHFVTDGIDAALQRARNAAGDLDVRIGGGADTLRQLLRRALIDDMHIAIVPILLGRGERLFDSTMPEFPTQYECAEVARTDAATHVRLVKRESAE